MDEGEEKRERDKDRACPPCGAWQACGFVTILDPDDEEIGPIGSALLRGGLDRQNAATLGRILGRGSVGHAEEGPDGKMRATVRIPEDELVFDPGILMLPHGGVLELELINDDNNTHCAVLPSNGDYQFIWLVNFSRGTATLELDGPGYYWYGSRTGNDEGRGLTGAIVVQGDVPAEARLDRPPQPRP